MREGFGMAVKEAVQGICCCLEAITGTCGLKAGLKTGYRGVQNGVKAKKDPHGGLEKSEGLK